MDARTERILSLVALLAALVIAVIALLQLDKRSKETAAAPSPTPTFVASPIASPPRPKAPAPTRAPVVAAPAATPTVAPPSTPTPSPVNPSPTPVKHVAGAKPLPHTGANPLPAGLALLGIGSVLGIVARRAY